MLNKINDHAVSLVEVLIALTILLIVCMGLVQASLLSINFNMRNNLRDEAVEITSEEISRLRSRSFDDMDGTAGTDPNPANFTVQIQRTYKNLAAPITYNIAVNITNLDADNKRITATTSWVWQGETIQHAIMTTRRR